MPSQIEHQLQQQLESRKERSLLRRLVVIPETSADFSSNDFLGLARNPQLGARFLKELESFPINTPPLGSTGSRLLDGNSRYAEELEALIAEFHHAEAALIFNSGFDANVGFFSSVPQPGDVILYDEYIHASVHDGMKVTRAGVKKAFLHNSLEHLEELLQTVRREDQQQASKGAVGPVAGLSGKNNTKTYKQRNIFVAVESVYSMDGDTAPLREIVDLLEQFGAHLIVDEVKKQLASYGSSSSFSPLSFFFSQSFSSQISYSISFIFCGEYFFTFAPALTCVHFFYARSAHLKKKSHAPPFFTPSLPSLFDSHRTHPFTHIFSVYHV
jgi:8-amino-7-oxononanoate synthase